MNDPTSTNPKHNRALRRPRARYRRNVRSDGARLIRFNPDTSRSKYVPHVGKKQIARQGQPVGAALSLRPRAKNKWKRIAGEARKQVVKWIINEALDKAVVEGQERRKEEERKLLTSP